MVKKLAVAHWTQELQ
nr:unnamed protein product [Callosobruchus chinensis]